MELEVYQSDTQNRVMATPVGATRSKVTMVIMNIQCAAASVIATDSRIKKFRRTAIRNKVTT